MRLGIDLGTTRTLVAIADRGNFPLIAFSSDSGDSSDHYPTTSAEVNGRLVHGLEAEDAARDGAPVLRGAKGVLLAFLYLPPTEHRGDLDLAPRSAA